MTTLATLTSIKNMIAATGINAPVNISFTVLCGVDPAGDIVPIKCDSSGRIVAIWSDTAEV
jgi:hypothetical protein